MLPDDSVRGVRTGDRAFLETPLRVSRNIERRRQLLSRRSTSFAQAFYAGLQQIFPVAHDFFQIL
jgi:hypothetical protein